MPAARRRTWKTRPDADQGHSGQVCATLAFLTNDAGLDDKPMHAFSQLIVRLCHASLTTTMPALAGADTERQR
ncbi:MAG: hypothetical protein CME72_08850 [Halomonadaceae bacterium]|nr:hypothetical protein [Halomonadaceae bacterium]